MRGRARAPPPPPPTHTHIHIHTHNLRNLLTRSNHIRGSGIKFRHRDSFFMDWYFVTRTSLFRISLQQPSPFFFFFFFFFFLWASISQTSASVFSFSFLFFCGSNLKEPSQLFMDWSFASDPITGRPFERNQSPAPSYTQVVNFLLPACERSFGNSFPPSLQSAPPLPPLFPLPSNV